jgi:branched-chain amino acid transport system substrate-binding protein
MIGDEMRHHIRWAVALCVGLCASLAAAQSGKPIKIGAISALGNGAVFPESSQAARAYFDTVNASGGIGGRPLQYLSMDEKMDPAATARAATQLLVDPEVVALVGSSGLLDCEVNQQRYIEAGILSLQGGSAAPACFRSPNIVPVNNGPYTGLASAVTFARQQLKSQHLCVVVLELPGMLAGYTQALQKLAAQTGQAAPPMQVVQLGGDWKPVLNSLEAQACDVVVFTGHESAVLQWLQSARELGFTGIRWVFLAPAYTARVAQALRNSADGIYAMSEFEPWNSRSLSSLDWRELMRQHKLPLSGLSQGGYLAAQLLVRTLRKMPAPITRASVTAALRQMPPQEHPLLGMPFHIGDAARHSPNRTAIPMQLVQGVWRIAAPDWIRVPDVH